MDIQLSMAFDNSPKDNSQKRVSIPLKDMEVYKLSRELSKSGWSIYEPLHWQDKKTMGDQFITSTDSVGANFTEGYHRFHYYDRIKFCHQARGSLAESAEYWLELLYERGKIQSKAYKDFQNLAQNLSVKLNNYITALYRSAANSKNTKRRT